jgi:hypothetical protein
MLQTALEKVTTPDRSTHPSSHPTVPASVIPSTVVRKRSPGALTLLGKLVAAGTKHHPARLRRPPELNVQESSDLESEDEEAQITPASRADFSRART